MRGELTDAATTKCASLYDFSLQPSAAGGKDPLWLKIKHKLLKLKRHGKQCVDMKIRATTRWTEFST